ncbi:MAG: SPOR domain-containing protein [Erythrobacter sp.]|nr:SPOR domain-containing protein [Erythrobacter sp.]
MRLPVRRNASFLLAGLGCIVASCAPFSDRVIETRSAGATSASSSANGPEADYPVVIGEPFTIDGITYTPDDSLNYNEVGYVALDETGATGITVAHRTLPLPSYVEITNLDSGRTILARVERRGPMINSRLVALSPSAMGQLGALEGAPVRVRRVNPPEEQRAELRADAEAPLRMETPEGLLAVLRQQLPAVGSAPLASAGGGARAPIQPIDPGASAENAGPSGSPANATNPPPASTPGISPLTNSSAATDTAVSAPSRSGNWVVQAGAFSSEAAAKRVAADIGGYVETVGRLFRVRTGPFESRGKAEAALAKLRGTGYKAAQVYSIR